MANKNLFKTKSTTRNAQSTNTVNEAGGTAYSMENRAALAQLASTGCISNTFYSTAQNQLDKVKKLIESVTKEEGGTKFLAQLAVYSRQSAFMKDMPALIMSFLAFYDKERYEQTFSRVIDNPKMLRNHVQIVRSGQINGKVSLPHAMRRQIRNWFRTTPNEVVFKTVGSNPSMADIIKMVHPKPYNKEQEATFAYVLGNKPITGKLYGANVTDLPKLVKDYEACKAAILSNEYSFAEIPNVPFQMLDSLGLKDEHWKIIAKNAKWQMTRMNLNTFNRHKVFEDKKMIDMVANRLCDKDLVKYSRSFPYQLFTAYLNATEVPQKIKTALHKAMELSIENIPEVSGDVYVFVDVSGSMGSSITGDFGRRVGSSMRCIDVAALIGASFLRRNPDAKIIPFDNVLHNNIKLNPHDSVFTIAKQLSAHYGGGTNCSLGTRALAAGLSSKQIENVDLVIYVSDNESWINSSRGYGYGRQTQTLESWNEIKKKCPHAKMVCIDLQPYTSTQAQAPDDGKSILNIGGFNDQVFTVISKFIESGNDTKYWVDEINKIVLDSPESNKKSTSVDEVLETVILNAEETEVEEKKLLTS